MRSTSTRVVLLVAAVTVVVGWVVWAWPGNEPSAKGAPVTTVHRATLPDDFLLLAAGGAFTGEAIPLDVRSVAYEPAGEGPTAPQERLDTGGRLIARSVDGVTSGPAALELVRLQEEGEEPAGQPDAWVRLGAYAEPLARSGEPRSPDRQGTAEWVWEDLPEGFWMVVALPDSPVLPASALPVRIRPGETRQAWLRLIPAGVVTARIERPDETPVVRAHVRLLGPLPPGFDPGTADPEDLAGVFDWRRKTDEDGVFVLNGVLPGARYALHAWTEEGTRATTTLLGRTRPAEPERVVATPSVQVGVLVQDSDTQQPVAGVQLWVMDHRLNALSGRPHEADTEVREIPSTDAHGRALARVEPGAWILTFKDEYDFATVQVTRRVAAEGRVVILVDRPDRRVIRVTTSDGRPVEDARVEVSWQGSRSQRIRKGRLPDARSDFRGEFILEDLGDLPDLDFGNIVLQARHDRAGVGGVAFDLLAFLEGKQSWPRTIVLQAPGSLQLHFASTGWPDWTPRMNPRWNIRDRAEQDTADQALDLTLRFLGTTSTRLDWSAHHDERRTVVVSGLAGDEPSVRYDNLEPGIYAVAVRSRARGFSFTTPSLRVSPGRLTEHWVEPPSSALHSTVTLALAAPEPARASALPEAVLSSVAESIGHAAHPSLLPPIVGEMEVRRVRMDPDGRYVFPFVPPGRYTIGLTLLDPAGPAGARAWRTTREFEVGPGDDLVLRTLEPGG